MVPLRTILLYLSLVIIIFYIYDTFISPIIYTKVFYDRIVNYYNNIDYQSLVKYSKLGQLLGIQYKDISPILEYYICEKITGQPIIMFQKYIEVPNNVYEKIRLDYCLNVLGNLFEQYNLTSKEPYVRYTFENFNKKILRECFLQIVNTHPEEIVQEKLDLVFICAYQKLNKGQ